MVTVKYHVTRSASGSPLTWSLYSLSCKTESDQYISYSQPACGGGERLYMHTHDQLHTWWVHYTIHCSSGTFFLGIETCKFIPWETGYKETTVLLNIWQLIIPSVIMWWWFYSLIKMQPDLYMTRGSLISILPLGILLCGWHYTKHILEILFWLHPIGWLRVCSTSSAKLMMISHKIKPVFKSTHGSILNNWPFGVRRSEIGLVYRWNCLGMRTMWISSKT